MNSKKMDQNTIGKMTLIDGVENVCINITLMRSPLTEGEPPAVLVKAIDKIIPHLAYGLLGCDVEFKDHLDDYYKSMKELSEFTVHFEEAEKFMGQTYKMRSLSKNDQAQCQQTVLELLMNPLAKEVARLQEKHGLEVNTEKILG